MSKSAKLSFAAIGAIAALVYYFAGERKPAPPLPPAAPVEAAAPKGRSSPAASAPASTWTVSTAPSPAVSTAPVPPSAALSAPVAVVPQAVPRAPVKELQAALQQAGTQGDAQISCRLGVELIRCVRLDYRQAMLKASQNALEQQPKDDPKTIQGLAEIEERARLLAEDRQVCGGSVAQSTARDAWKHLYQAAAAGNVAAMSQFVRDPGMDPRDPAMEEGWEVFKRKAPEFLTKAIQGGDVKALWQGWFTANSGYSAGTNKTFERDPYKALVYGLVVVNLVDAQRSAQVALANPALAAQLGPERAAQAQKEAETLRAASFSDNAAPIEWSTDSGETDSGECLK